MNGSRLFAYHEPGIVPIVVDADISFIAGDLRVTHVFMMFLHEIPCERRRIILVVEDSLVRDYNIVYIAKNALGHSGTETI